MGAVALEFPTIECDPDEASHILQSEVENGVSEYSWGSCPTGPAHRLGIPVEMLQDIFRHFTQADSSTTRGWARPFADSSPP